MEEDTITLEDVFRFTVGGMNEQGGIASAIEPTGLRPRIMDRPVRQRARGPGGDPRALLGHAPAGGRLPRLGASVPGRVVPDTGPTEC